MALMSLRVFDFLGYLTGYNLLHPHMYNISGPFKYFIGPLYFFFVLFSINRKRGFRIIDILHLIIPVYFLINQVPVYFEGAEYKLTRILYIIDPVRERPITELLYGQMYIAQIFAYVVMVHFEIKEATTDKFPLLRLKQFNHAFAVFIGLDFGIKLVAYTGALPGGATEYLLLFTMALLIHWLGYIVIHPAELAQTRANGNGDKYKTSPLTAELLSEYKTRITNYFDSVQPYLDCNLKINDIATSLEIPAHHLSQVMSQEMQTSFNDFVNNYRVKEVKRKLQNPKNRHYKLLSIAYDSGFNNKTSFNRAFKRTTGITPSEYLKSLQ